MNELREVIPYINLELMGGLPRAEVFRLIDEISKYENPVFLVSMKLHRNLIVNEAALKLMDSSPEELFAKSLPKLWVPPPHVKPISDKAYEENLPPHLQEMHQLLTQQSELIGHKYHGWKVNGADTDAIWVSWTSDIKYKEIKDSRDETHPLRLMVCQGFDEVQR